MEIMLKFLLLFVGLVGVNAGLYHPHLHSGNRAFVKHLREQGERSVRRSVTEPEAIFTDKMSFRIKFENGKTITLHLKLNTDQIGKVIVKVISQSGTEFFDDTKRKDYRFYQVIGEDHSASVMVRCEDFTQPCYLVGNFFHDMVEYIIDPDTDIAHKVSSVPHTVYEVKPHKPTHPYNHDTVQVVSDDSNTSNQGKRGDLMYLLAQLLKLQENQITERQLTPKNYKIELEILVADDVYAFWLARLSNNRDAAIEKITQYFEQVANNMDLRFSTATTPTMTIDIIPKIITIIQDKTINSWITGNIVNVDSDGNEAYHAETALDELYTWAVKNRDKNADALVCFSRRDMWSNGQRSGKDTVGIARSPIDNIVDQNPLSGLCTNNAVSLNEVFRNGDTSGTASHELAHNMGIKHDMDYNDAACKDDKLYIMAATIGFVSDAADAKNPWTFSKCSVSEMERLMSTVDQDSAGKICLEKHSYNVTANNIIQTSSLLGQIYSLDQQCELLIGKGSMFCKIGDIGADELCWKGLLCTVPDASYCEYRSPLSGSSCGGTKKCYQGTCVDSLPNVATDPTNSVVSKSSTPVTKSSSTTSTTSTATAATTTPSTTTSTTISTPTSTTSVSSSSSTRTTRSSTSTASTSTIFTTNPTSSVTDAYTQEEYDILEYCEGSCYCWRLFRYCWWHSETSLCELYYDVCFK